jgi:hypothetical protein
MTTRQCSICGQVGSWVQGQTVKALLSISLRTVQTEDYLFCQTQSCPIVYFSPGGIQAFTVEQVREPIYQKQPDRDETLICYCFRYTVGEVKAATPKARAAIIDEINAGIQAGQCACDLRNPQGSCCLGNIHRLILKG